MPLQKLSTCLPYSGPKVSPNARDFLPRFGGSPRSHKSPFPTGITLNRHGRRLDSFRVVSKRIVASVVLLLDDVPSAIHIYIVCHMAVADVAHFLYVTIDT